MNAAQTLGFARQMEVEMSKEGAITPELIGALTGAGVGGLAGYAGTDDPRKKWRHALLGAGGGGIAGGLLGHAAGTPDELTPVERANRIVHEQAALAEMGRQVAAKQEAARAAFQAAGISGY